MMLLLSHHLAQMLYGLRGHICSLLRSQPCRNNPFELSGIAEAKSCQVSVQLGEPLHGHKEGDKGHMDKARDRWAWVEHTTSFSRLMLR